MFELFANLIMTGMFLQSQAQKQMSIENLTAQVSSSPRLDVIKQQLAAPQKKTDSDSLGVKVSADSYLVIDDKTGKVLSSKNPLTPRSIASITKLMTALVFLDHNPGWSKEFTVSSTDYREGGIVYLNSGERFTEKDIFNVMLVASSNEAAAALARSTGLSSDQFVIEMNKKAKDLGMNQSAFTDPTGLDAGDMATAKDVILMLRAAFRNEDLARTVSRKEYQFQPIGSDHSRTAVSTDKALGESFGYGNDTYSVQAGKTGYIDKAGYCFASRVVDDNGRKILVVVLGSDTLNARFTDTKSLAYWAFNNYRWPSVGTN